MKNRFTKPDKNLFVGTAAFDAKYDELSAPNGGFADVPIFRRYRILRRHKSTINRDLPRGSGRRQSPCI